jgi:hypothetical protein
LKIQGHDLNGTIEKRNIWPRRRNKKAKTQSKTEQGNNHEEPRSVIALRIFDAKGSEQSSGVPDSKLLAQILKIEL